MARPSSRILRPPMRHIHRATLCDGALLSEVRFLACRSDRVNLIRPDGLRFTVVRNGDLYLVRDEKDEPIGTHDTVLEAIAAGDAWLDRVAEEDIDDSFPRGAA